MGEVSKEKLITLTKEDYVKLQALVGSKSPTESSATLTHSGNYCLFYKESSSILIIDYRASNHMTGDNWVFSSIDTSCSNAYVILVDETSTNVIRIDTANHTSSLHLEYSLYLTQFPLSLLFVSTLTKSLNYFVSFFPSCCIFQNLNTKKVIGEDCENGGLYYLNQKTYLVVHHADTSSYQ